MPLFSRKKLSFHGLASQSTKQPPPVCTWSAHTPQSGPSPLQFPRSSHTLTATADGELFLFGGYVHGHESTLPSRDLYAFSTRDFSATLLQTSGKVPTRRVSHGAALIGTTLLICGGKTNFLNQNALSQRQNDSLYRLNLESREWTRVVVNGPGPGGRYFHTVTMIRSKLFVFGGVMGGKSLNDVWALNSLNSQPFWESYEPAPGNEKPPPRTGHVSVSTEDRIIVFGGSGNLRHYNDTWSFDISARKWTELQCTGSIPSPRSGHAAVLVDGIMYVFGGYTGKAHLDDLIGLQLSTQRWFKFHNQGTSPCGRSNHAMASDGVRVFVLGGYSENARVESVDQFSLIHVFDTRDIKYTDPERNAVNPNEKTTQPARKSSTGRPSELTSVNSELRRVPEDDVSEGSTKYHAESAAPHSFSEGEVTRLELDRQLSALLAAQTERDQRIAQLTGDLALKSALLEQAEANATEAKKHEELKLREHQANLDELMLSHDQHVRALERAQSALRKATSRAADADERNHEQIGQYQTELAHVRTNLEAKESELKAVRLRLEDAENALTKSKREADTLRAPAATGFANRDEDQVTHGLMERMRAIEAQMTSKRRNEKSIEPVESNEERWNEKDIESMECSNGG